MLMHQFNNSTPNSDLSYMLMLKKGGPSKPTQPSTQTAGATNRGRPLDKQRYGQDLTIYISPSRVQEHSMHLILI